MLKSLVKAKTVRHGARVLPGGWLTMAALSPRGRSTIKGAWKRFKRRR